MTEANKILIKNIYYMLCYAFQVLRQSNYEEVAAEDFENAHDLFAAILAKGMAQQLKQGLYRDYVLTRDDLNVLRGKLDMQGTIANRVQRKPMLTCEYDELTENNVLNQILKTTAAILLRVDFVKDPRRKELKRVLLFLRNVDTVDPASIKWNALRFHRHNRGYKMLLNICRFVLEDLLLTTEKGSFKMPSFLDGQSMPRLFEKFVLEYYRYHHPLLKASPKQIQWDTDEGSRAILPAMNTDVTLKYGERTLIIDTKYYSRTLRRHALFGTHSLHSANLYQVFTYVKNADAKKTGNVAGLLLYAKTTETISSDCDVEIGGNKIAVRTLDLNVPFTEIAAQLDGIAASHFNDYSAAERRR
jgi:5-methylcytosine-specific restriction enzyme subunit McrC